MFLQVPLFPSTKHMFNEDVLPKLKRGMALINTSRGGTYIYVYAMMMVYCIMYHDIIWRMSLYRGGIHFRFFFIHVFCMYFIRVLWFFCDYLTYLVVSRCIYLLCLSIHFHVWLQFCIWCLYLSSSDFPETLHLQVANIHLRENTGFIQKSVCVFKKKVVTAPSSNSYYHNARLVLTCKFNQFESVLLGRSFKPFTHECLPVMYPHAISDDLLIFWCTRTLATLCSRFAIVLLLNAPVPVKCGLWLSLRPGGHEGPNQGSKVWNRGHGRPRRIRERIRIFFQGLQLNTRSGALHYTTLHYATVFAVSCQ